MINSRFRVKSPTNQCILPSHGTCICKYCCSSTLARSYRADVFPFVRFTRDLPVHHLSVKSLNFCWFTPCWVKSLCLVKKLQHRFCSQHFLTMFDPFPCPVSTFHPPSVCPSLVGAFVLASAQATVFSSSRQRWDLTGKTCYAKLGEMTMGFQPPVETEVTLWVSPEMGYCTK